MCSVVSKFLIPGAEFLRSDLGVSASENPFKGNLTSLPKPGGGEFGKFYSLPSLNDPRVGKFANFACFDFSL